MQRRPDSAFSRWWARRVQAVGSDLAVHGLAYLGVLLFFVGVFGLVVFAFGDVTPGLRPLAEVVIALAPFVAGAMLLKRQAITVGRALEVLGGVLLPIMVLTSFVDDVAFPPDVHGILLVVVLTVLTALIAASYAWWSNRRERSALRYLVAPIAWLAVAMATLGLARAVPVGKEVAVPSAAQVAAIAAALVATLAWARLRPRARLAGPTLSVAGPGLFVVALLGVLTWKAEGWPAAPVLISGVLVLTALELLRDRLPVAVPGLAEPLWWALVWSALVSGVGVAQAGAAAAIGFVLITEVAAAARRPVWAVTLPAMGAVAALASTLSDSRWATMAFTTATVWALGRRMRPYAVPGAAVALDLAAAVLPAFALASLAAASNPATAVAAGAGLVALATLPAVKPLMRRDAGDTFWTLWWRTAGTVMALAAAVVWTTDLSTGQQWLITASLVVLAAAGTVGPIPSVGRPWPVTALFAAAWFSACATLEAPDMVRVSMLGVAGLGMVVGAHVLRWGSGRERAAGVGTAGVGTDGAGAVGVGFAGSFGLAGHVLGVVAVLVATSGRWSLVAAVGLGTAGWVVTTVWDVRDASPVGRALRRLGGWAGWLPVVVAGVGLPLTVALGLDAAGVLGFDHPWAMVVPAVVAVAYSAATWLRLPDRVGATAAWGGFAAGLVASLVAAERLPQALGLGALVVSVVVLRPARRVPVMTWVAWVGLAPLAGLLTAQGWPWFDALGWQMAVVLTLVTVGGVLLVGGLAADLRGRRWAPRLLPARASTLAPVVVGGGELVAGLGLAYLWLTRDQAGWVSAAVAGVVLVTAVLVRVGALAGVGTVLGWAAVVLLAGQQIDARPWIPVVVALALLVVAQVLSMAPAPAPAETRAETSAEAEAEGKVGAEAAARVEVGLKWWARWDLPLLVTAVPVAITALVAAGNAPRWGATFAAVGLECLAVGLRLRRSLAVAVPVAAVGTALLLAGADNAGEGWLALALLGLSVALTTLAAYTRRSMRLPCQIGGALAALASWQVATVWLDWTVQQSIDVTAAGAGVLAMAAALLVRANVIERSWLLVWGGMAVVVATLVAGYTETIAEVGLADATPSWPVATGLLLVAAALVTSAGPLAQTWIRGLGMAFVTVSVVEALQAGDAGTGVQAAVLALLSAIFALLSLSLFVRQRAQTWQRPPLALGVALSAGSVLVAVGSATTHDAMLLVPGLAASAVQAAAVGIVLRNTRVEMLSPVLACAAWLVFSAGAMGDNAQWVTVPLGLAILTVVELWRQDRRRRGGRLAATEIVVLELAGVAFLVGAAFVQTVTVAVAYAALAAILGLAVIGWGVLTRVRRRLAAGALIVLASLVLLIAVPLVGLMPAWQGAALWVLIAAVGLMALLVASFLEQGKAAALKGMSRFGEATAGWE